MDIKLTIVSIQNIPFHDVKVSMKAPITGETTGDVIAID